MPHQEIFQLRDCKTRRISSFDKTGGNADRIIIQPGETAEIASISGPGIIRHIWMTIGSDEPMNRRNTIFRIYWDQEPNPSVLAPVGDFFGQGFGENYPFVSQYIAAAPVQGRGLSCYFPMPFRQHARITITNENTSWIGLYFYIDYEIPSSPLADAAYFHALWNREITASHNYAELESDEAGAHLRNPSDENNYRIADIVGKGHLVGIQYYVDNPTSCWYGEGDDMLLIDGEPWPGSHHGTGTEDFFNSAWCPNELYAHPYFGYAKVPSKIGWMGRTHCYRFFLEDPICFETSLRFSIEHGHANCLTLDLSSVAYWYQTEPHQPFAEILPRQQRENMPPISHRDVHKWRQAWLASMKEKESRPVYWGNET
ncbi:MAG: glycoside hydrolase family 172 protein [Candidatus Merdivicinus sp.]|jgi:hypothetical protein